ncbi:MAG: RluA family pseudouridine synthase [Pseudomonadota bacterium]
MSGVQILTVGEGEGDQRLDRWLKRRFPHLGQGRIEKMCRKGELRVDGGRAKPSSRVETGQSVRVPPLPDPDEIKTAHYSQPRPRISDADAAMIQSTVLYRDAHVIAINKPPGLPSQGGSGQLKHVDGLAEALKFDLDEKPRLVHRLDKDTSGILLLARSRLSAAALSDAFRARTTRKIYWAVVAGTPSPSMGTIRYGLKKAMGHGARGEAEKMICVHPEDVDRDPDAKRATSDYAVLSALGRRAAWMALVPVTGRTHQLRAHMAEMGHPIIGDGKYGGSSQENLGDGWGAQLGGEMSKKLHLHARHLSFEHPITGAQIRLTAPLPEHMARTWDTLGWAAGDVPVDPFEDLV